MAEQATKSAARHADRCKGEMKMKIERKNTKRNKGIYEVFYCDDCKFKGVGPRVGD